jgi:hypothetical protein
VEVNGVAPAPVGATSPIAGRAGRVTNVISLSTLLSSETPEERPISVEGSGSR